METALARLLPLAVCLRKAEIGQKRAVRLILRRTPKRLLPSKTRRLLYFGI